MSVRCRLVRADGSRWHIKELREVDQGFRVDAVPNGAGGPGDGGDAGHGRDGVRERLENELLARGDRIEWVEESGEVLWAMKFPVNGSEISEQTADSAAQ